MLLRRNNKKTKVLLLGLVLAASFMMGAPSHAFAIKAEPPGGGSGTPVATPCGEGDTAYTPSIDLGCKGKGNAIMDLTFAIIRFISYGVGLVIVGSLTYAGIQYTGSRGDPNATALAVKRIQANVIALLLFIFAFAIVNYLIPGTFLT
jgi:hypothetical protein